MRSATSSKISLIDRFKMALQLHKKNFLSSLLDILRQPTSSLMTILVLAVALALPSAFYVFTNNAQSLSGNWNGGVQMSLYLTEAASEQSSAELLQQLDLRPEFDSVILKSKAQALEEFKEFSGLAGALDYLPENPLPMEIVLVPALDFASAQQLETLKAEFEQNRLVDVITLDMNWVRKYQAILDISQKIATFISGLLALAVFLIVGNTIRLAILSRREEIQVIKLVGATDAFIRRPFLYTGFWYGIIAAFIAALMVSILIKVLQSSAEDLARQYNSNFSLLGLSPQDTLSLLTIGAILGLIGAWISVRKHLKDIQPN